MERYKETSQVESLSLFLNRYQVRVENVTGSHPLKCATLGPEATFSEQAALELMQDQVEISFVKSNPQIVESVNKKEFDIGIIASENSIEGNVDQTLRAIIHSDLTILGERILPVHQTLYGTKEAMEKGVVNTHPQGYAQCVKWLQENIPHHSFVSQDSTSLGVKIAAEKNELGIGSPIAGERYGIPLLKSQIEDRKGNTTRFWLLGNGDTEPTGQDRTKFVVTLQNKAGTLKKVVDSFADREISINKIDTIPLNLDHYFFLISVDGHIMDTALQEAMNEAKQYCWKVKHIGSFQKSVLPNVEYDSEAFEKGWVPMSESHRNGKKAINPFEYTSQIF